ncbi:MAG TPA: hypothetical protein VJM12_09450 [Pyrinomonadaceae bacterium]|nr:hypothetical protein [Pyrinomonadaceae bacterium]
MNKDKLVHPDLASGRWFTLTLAEQLGNVGSEYERARRWKDRDEQSHFENAFDRMLELLDLTIADQRWHNHRLKELVRLREVICEEFFGEPYGSSTGDLRNYFLYFGLLARKDK